MHPIFYNDQYMTVLMKKFRTFTGNTVTAALLALSAASCTGESGGRVFLTLIPPGEITDCIDLDIRAGVVNDSKKKDRYKIEVYRTQGDTAQLLMEHSTVLMPGETRCFRHMMETGGLSGKNRITLKVTSGNGESRAYGETSITRSGTRSTGKIGGAFVGICHWSEVEGKHWNDDIRKLTDEDWRMMVRSMHRLGMDIIVIQELFRNEEYAGKHTMTADTYPGKAYYDSGLYRGRVRITAEDPVEAIFSEADSLGMHVFPGIGLYAWFDFSEESLEWHKLVAREVWGKYGHHRSFYGFYVPEESGGSLDNWEKTPEMRAQRKREIVTFFKEFKSFCNSLAPGKPVMLATNSFGIRDGLDTYPALLENLDILCPFGFARMPEGDITGQEAAGILQELCDNAGAHLWFDLEAFLFYDDSSLYPRDIKGITDDLETFSNFEKVICYQFPGVFSDPQARIRVGEEKTETLFREYGNYIGRQ